MRVGMHCLLTLLLPCLPAKGDFLPENNWDLEIQLMSSNVNEKQFNNIISKAEDFYQPIIESHGGKLKINRLWSNNTVNANAKRVGEIWEVNMYGGLARRPEVTPDGFALVVCHEIGHHIAGFPRISGWFNRWAANEGQSDYFSTQTCARELWKDEQSFRGVVDSSAQEICDDVWTYQPDRALCYRMAMAGKSLATLMAKGGTVEFSTPDKSQVTKTYSGHPKAQCRLDTFLQGALCTQEFDIDRIPRNFEDAASQSCTRTNQFAVGVRPRCWFKPES